MADGVLKKRDFVPGKKFRVIISEAFYFFSALLALGACLEIFVPGLFGLYFNEAILAACWLMSLVLLLLYVRQ